MIERVGGKESRRVDVRVISATNQDLRKLLATNRFRQDLFYRLDVIRIEIPPLRQRPDDIPLLFYHFLQLLSRRHSQPVPSVADDAVDRLAGYPFPGNVRQLRNMVERLLILTYPQTRITTEHLPTEVREGIPPPSRLTTGLEGLMELEFREAREAFEVRYLLSQLREHSNNITHTARAIGLHRQSLQQKIKNLSLRELV